jgi:hypothetical protein
MKPDLHKYSNYIICQFPSFIGPDIPLFGTGNISLFQPHYGPGVDSASNRNEHQESSWRGKGWWAHKADNLTAIYEPIV